MATPLRAPRPLDPSLISIVEDTSPEERTTHAGSCHCGTVQFDVTLKWPFPKYPINKCTCSICTKNGYLFVYPKRSDVVIKSGEDNISSYEWNWKQRHHKFCKTCGSSIMIDFRVPVWGEGEAKTDPRMDIIAVNVRMLNDFDLNAVEYTYFDGKHIIPTNSN